MPYRGAVSAPKSASEDTFGSERLMFAATLANSAETPS
jgi:hypothetical protein